MSAKSKSGLRVLVMDDEYCVRDTIEKLLRELGFIVDTACNGAEAIRLFADAVRARRPYRAIILDLTVPGGGGAVETLPRLKQIDPDVKAIVTSGYHYSPEMQEPQKHGFCGKLPKPCGIAELRRTMAMLLCLPNKVDYKPDPHHSVR
jgi:CheY-like chemotaxis protein